MAHASLSAGRLKPGHGAGSDFGTELAGGFRFFKAVVFKAYVPAARAGDLKENSRSFERAAIPEAGPGDLFEGNGRRIRLRPGLTPHEAAGFESAYIFQIEGAFPSHKHRRVPIHFHILKSNVSCSAKIQGILGLVKGSCGVG